MQKSSHKTYRYEALVGFGGNEGDVKKTFAKVLNRWQRDRRIAVLKTSSILENPPFGYLEQDRFFNAIALIKTSLSPKKLLRFLLHTEKLYKRKRSFKNAPRTLDLDLIMFKNHEMNDKVLSLPHPYWRQRVSVLAPMLEMGLR